MSYEGFGSAWLMAERIDLHAGKTECFAERDTRKRRLEEREGARATRKRVSGAYLRHQFPKWIAQLLKLQA